MTRIMLAAIAGLGVLLILALWRVDSLGESLELANKAAAQSERRAESLRATLTLQRELATDTAKIDTDYQAEVKDAQDEAERLRRCIADGTCGLRVAATCVRVDRPTATASEPDAGTPRLTATAERAYPALVAGLKTQRAQITGLQKQLTTLHSKCKIGG
ncbi:MAG: lysis system i-spanin subunit Rz [Pseudomonadales bacterium]